MSMRMIQITPGAFICQTCNTVKQPVNGNIAWSYLSILHLPRELFPTEAKCETCSTGKWAEGFARMDGWDVGQTK